MIQIIAGLKGSGKTKRLIHMTNDTANTANHSVVFLDKDNSYMYEIDRNVRFVNVTDYHVASAEMFLGFLGGMLASNYDIGYIFIDAFLKLVKKDIAEAGDFIKSLEELGQKHEVTFVLSVSADAEQLPDFAKSYVI
ncbi:MAG: twitching motility protein PilT [Christensenellaceae bacterium]|nr:twitching motility protein PilT [Christensenellaceae bacterium]